MSLFVGMGGGSERSNQPPENLIIILLRYLDELRQNLVKLVASDEQNSAVKFNGDLLSL